MGPMSKHISLRWKKAKSCTSNREFLLNRSRKNKHSQIAGRAIGMVLLLVLLAAELFCFVLLNLLFLVFKELLRVDSFESALGILSHYAPEILLNEHQVQTRMYLLLFCSLLYRLFSTEKKQQIASNKVSKVKLHSFRL